MSTITRITTTSAMFLSISIGLTSALQADPLPGEVLKFQQKPLSNTAVGGAIYNGHAEVSTAYQGVNSQGLTEWQGGAVADDFADNYSTPVVHVKWWGDYLNNPNNKLVQQFLITFESDVPSTGQPGSFSHPGMPLLNQIVTAGALSPASGTFVETQPNTALPLMQYNAELAVPFQEQKDTVYWLKIVALVDPATQGNLSWGWHNRDYMVQDTLASPVPTPGEGLIGPASQPMWHFQDDAVRSSVDINTLAPPGLSVFQDPNSMGPLAYDGLAPTNYDGPSAITGYSEDMAFELYTVPEPSTAGLIMVGACAFLARRRRK